MNKRKLIVSVILFAVLLLGLVPALTAAAASPETLTAAGVTLSADSFAYTGSVQKPTVTVKNAAGTKLTASTHYTLSYSGDCKYPGTYTVTVTGKGSYTGTITKTYNIVKQSLSESRVTLSAVSFPYNGTVQQPSVTVKSPAGSVLTSGTSYSVAYSAQSKALGTYTVTVTGKGNYTGTVTKTYSIVKQSLADSRVTLSASSFPYNGTVQRPSVIVKSAAGSVLTSGTSYSVAYSAQSKALGTYTVTVTGKGNYTGTVTKTYSIVKQSLADSRVTLSASSFPYNGTVQRPSVIVKSAAGSVLTSGTSYSVAYSAQSKALGTYTVTVTGKGNYTGTVTKTYSIVKQSLADSRVTLSAASFPYNGTVQRPSVIVKSAAGSVLTSGTSYSVAYSAQSKALGTYTVTVTGKGNYTGTVTKTYSIVKQSLDNSRVTLSAASFPYNGTVQQPSVIVKSAAGSVLTNGTSYSVEYSAQSKALGTYTVTVTGKGNYTGTVTKTYSIVKQSLADSRVTLSTASFPYNGTVQQPTVTVKSAAGSILTSGTSYTVAYSAQSKAVGSYTVTVTGNGNYTGTVTKTYSIVKQSLSASRVTLSADSFYANGNVQHPIVTVKSAAGSILTSGTSYTVAYPESAAPGSYTLTVTGKGNYTGAVTKTYTILPSAAITADDVVLSGTCFKYNGSKQQPSVTVTVDGVRLAEGTDYTVALSGAAIENGAYTLTVTGVNAYTGTVNKTFVISASGHTPEVIPGTDATCTETGMSEGSRCTVCGEIITAPAVIPALGHDLTLTPAVAATCLAGGNNAYYTCGRCDKVFTDADGRNETTAAAQATAILPHSFTGSPVSNNDGTHTVQCVNGCGETRTEDCAFGEWEVITEGTCDVEGQRTHTCAVCGFEAEEAYFGHEFVWKHYPATCVAGAFREKVCENCGDIFATQIDESSESLGGHNLPTTAEPVPATCTEEGYTEKRCQNCYTIEYYDENDEINLYNVDEQCSYVEKEVTSPALGHDLPEANWVEKMAPSCLAGGLEECECLRCHEIFTRETDSLGGHQYEAQGEPATCTEDGYTEYACKNCGRVFEGSYRVLPAAHAWNTTDVTVLKAPNCTDTGMNVRFCKNCSIAAADLKVGDLVRTKSKKNGVAARTYGTISAVNGSTYTLDFSISGINATGDYAASALLTQTTQIIVTPIEHDLDPTVVPATCTQNGSITYSGYCSRCSQWIDGETVTIEKLGHLPDRESPSCTEPVVCLRPGCDCENSIIEPALGHNYTVPGCVLSPTAKGFFCSRCQQMTADKTGTMTELLNLIKSSSFIAADPTNPPTVASAIKTKTSTVNKTFDFGVYTSLVKDIYEKDVSETTVEYVAQIPTRVRDVFPLTTYYAGGKYYVVKTGDEGFSDADLNNIKVEQLSGLNTNELLNGFDEKPTSGSLLDLSSYVGKQINEPVIKISLDVADDIYAKNSSINNVDDTLKANGDYLHDTHISKIFDYDIRVPVKKAGFNNENGWIMEDGKQEDGYHMEMQLNSVKADARITYYFTANDYRPIGAVYQIKETMDQKITMKILTVDGTIIPVITTDCTYAYLFSDFFNN